MIHSVWDWDRLRYNVYESPLPSSVGGWKPLTGLGIQNRRIPANSVGGSLESALPVLPPSAVLKGWSTDAVGQVCVGAAAQPQPLRSLSGGISDALTDDYVQNLLGAFIAGTAAGVLWPHSKLLSVATTTGALLLLGIHLGSTATSKKLTNGGGA